MPIVWEIYRHYKSTWWNDHTYEIIWIAKHSETDEILVIYKPLYQITDKRLWEASIVARPFCMREEDVEYNWKIMKRFTKIS